MAAAGTPGRRRLLKEEDMTKVEFETSEEVDVTPTFDTMGLREDLLRGIYAYGRPVDPEASRVRSSCEAESALWFGVGPSGSRSFSVSKYILESLTWKRGDRSNLNVVSVAGRRASSLAFMLTC